MDGSNRTEEEKIPVFLINGFRRKGSTAVNMVEPVVVKPETVSKKASIKLGMSPESTKGSAPKRDIKIHARDTTARPSRAYRDICPGKRHFACAT